METVVQKPFTPSVWFLVQNRALRAPTREHGYSQESRKQQGPSRQGRGEAGTPVLRQCKLMQLLWKPAHGNLKNETELG